MAPDSSQLKRKPRENQYIFDLGVRGRKTGLTVEDTGIRDENGLEPMDHLFSSPEKSTRKANSNGRNANTTISSEEDMELVESSLPEYETGRKRTGMRMPLPHSRSPKKTFLQSPARRNPSLGPLSSPSRGSIIVPRGPPESISVRRRLDFSNENFEGSMADTGAKGRSSQKGEDVRATIRTGRGKAVQPTSMKSPNQDDDGYDEYDDPQAQYYENEEDPNQIMEGGDDEVDQVESEAEPEPEPPKKSKGKGKAKEPEAKPSEAKKGRGRKKRDSNVAGLDESEAPTKKTRRSLESAKATTTRKSRNTATKESKAKTAPTKGRKPKAAKTNLAPIAENDSPAVQRGPPMPRNNRGLIILRRETPMDSDGFKTTRSGRNSVRPVQFWKNERIEYSDDENEHNGGDKFLLPRVKGVVRVDEVEEPRKRRQHHKSNKGKKRAVAVESEEEDEIEPWEMNPGRLVGEIRIWDPEDQTGMHTEEAEEEIALSSTAIVMKDTAGTFKFAKTLSTPFFATGMVDLPPGAEKKPKNSRKMQMVFFVFYGRVEVTVNDNKFRIGKGGMWQVPRGNFYSINNDYENPARIFFAQGCEVVEDATGDIALPVQ